MLNRLRHRAGATYVALLTANAGGAIAFVAENKRPCAASLDRRQGLTTGRDRGTDPWLGAILQPVQHNERLRWQRMALVVGPCVAGRSGDLLVSRPGLAAFLREINRGTRRVEDCTSGVSGGTSAVAVHLKFAGKQHGVKP